MSDVVKKVVLDLGGKEISLTLKQAKNLQSALDELFGERVRIEKTVEHIHDYLPQPYYSPQPAPWHWRHRDTIWCSGDNKSKASFKGGTVMLALDNETT